MLLNLLNIFTKLNGRQLEHSSLRIIFKTISILIQRCQYELFIGKDEHKFVDFIKSSMDEVKQMDRNRCSNLGMQYIE